MDVMVCMGGESWHRLTHRLVASRQPSSHARANRRFKSRLRASCPVANHHPYPPKHSNSSPHTMSELRRKLVIVGDGACGKVLSTVFLSLFVLINLFRTDLSLDSLF